MNASHDHGEAGLAMETKIAIIERLQQHGRVVLTQEGGLSDREPETWRALQCSLPPHQMHHLLAFASLIVGDSHTMTLEGAFLGTPALRLSSFAGRLEVIEHLEQRYGLIHSFTPQAVAALLETLDRLLHDPDLQARYQGGHQRLLQESRNIAEWYTDFIEKQGPSSVP